MEGNIITVIAWDGKTLAADSRMSFHSSITTDSARKIYALTNVLYLGDKLLAMGMSGSCGDFDKLAAYMHSDDYLKEDIVHEVHAIVIGEKHVYELEPNCKYMIRHDKKQKLASGCGHMVARSAMLLGLTAEEAVKHTIKLDHSCGGKIRTWREGDER